MKIEGFNPATGERIYGYEEFTASQVETMLAESRKAFLEWRETPYAHRSALMKKAAALLRKPDGVFAKLMATEMGKPLAQGKGEVEKCAVGCDFFAENAEKFLQREEAGTPFRSFVSYQPLGVLLAIMPWNFPFWQVFRAAAPALMAGNAVVLKHSSNVFGCALAIEEVFRQAGFPKGLFRSLLIGSKQALQLVGHPAIAAVTLTGSTPAGQAVAAAAGKALKKSVLELGGSDPYVVLGDADLEKAAETCAASRLINSGQSCIAAKRFIVVDSVLEEFQRLFVERMAARKMGDPFEEGVAIGPMARQDLRDSLHEQVEKSVSEGATLLLGGKTPASKGAFYPATVLGNVRKGMTAFDEETFGPVAAVVSAKDEEEAIQLANDSVFGLGAAVFTRDKARGEEIAATRLEAGNCFVNMYVQSDPRLPFGGIKQSGFGRELSSFGIREFVNIKTVAVS
ncbi:MAG TPA: NAD-dependent succinate-semialdehyde dehydrogenase [Candidatus Saccharimonadales bacterium]|nr:NAD-dependent succinate-semialdehyde dehydrogenase [Candidatus Saccharimonadales bacterium]